VELKTLVSAIAIVVRPKLALVSSAVTLLWRGIREYLVLRAAGLTGELYASKVCVHNTCDLLAISMRRSYRKGHEEPSEYRRSGNRIQLH